MGFMNRLERLREKTKSDNGENYRQYAAWCRKRGTAPSDEGLLEWDVSQNGSRIRKAWSKERIEAEGLLHLYSQYRMTWGFMIVETEHGKKIRMRDAYKVGAGVGNNQFVDLIDREQANAIAERYKLEIKGLAERREFFSLPIPTQRRLSEEAYSELERERKTKVAAD